MHARITTDTRGHVYPGSICAIDGVTVDVPTDVNGVTAVKARVEAAVERLDWVVVNWDLFRADRNAGWFEVLVDLPGAGS